MKILIHNYSSETCTEPLYLAQGFRDKKIRTHLWNNECSAFDVFDEHEPDVFIANYMRFDKDVLKRLKGSNTHTLLNVTGPNVNKEFISDSLDGKVTFFQNYNINPGTFVLSPCADIYVKENVRLETPEYKINTLYVVDNPKDLDLIKPLSDKLATFHVASTNKKMLEHEECDVYLSSAQLSAIYEKYDEVVVTKPNQIFYDAAYYNGRCGICNGKEISNFLEKRVVKSSHVPYNRVEQLLNYLEKK